MSFAKRPLAVAIVAVVAMLLATVTVSAGPIIELSAARGVMIDRQISATEDAHYGTRAVSLRGPVKIFSTAQSGGHYKGTTVYVSCAEHLSKSSLSELRLAPIRGMLVELCQDDTANEEILAHFLASTSVTYPVYFVEDAAVGALLKERGDSTTEYVVIAAGKSARQAVPSANRTFPAQVIYSSLAVRTREATAGVDEQKTGSAPRVLITANFDSFGVAPSVHTTGGASGAAAAIELYRRQALSAAMRVARNSSVASSPTMYAASMLLGSTARFNYAATAAWLHEQKDNEMDRCKLIICLDELLPLSGSSDHEENAVLYMHLPDTFMRRADGRQLAELAQQLAKAHGISLKVQPARTNYEHYDLRFEHEVFAHSQLPAVTFSTHRTHVVDQVFRGGRQTVNDKSVAVLAKRVDYLSSLVNALLGTEGPAHEGESWVGAESYLLGLLRSAAAAVRSPLASNGEPLEDYANVLAQHLRQIDASARAIPAQGSRPALSVSTVHRQFIVKPTGLVVYGPYEETLRMFVAKTSVVELAVMACVAAALLLFGIGELGVSGLRQAIAG